MLTIRSSGAATMQRGSARGLLIVCNGTAGNGQAFKLSALTSTKKVVSVAEPARTTSSGPSMPLIAGAAAVGLAVLMVIKKLSNNYGSSFQHETGYGGAQRGRRDVFMNGVMKNVNTMPVPSLSDEQIAAARERRLKERGDVKVNTLEDIELPDNHPWATRAPANQDQDRVRARMPLRRPGPPQQQQQPNDGSITPRRNRQNPSQVTNEGQSPTRQW